MKNFGAELKKNGSTDPVKFIFNDSKADLHADDSSSPSPGATAAEEGEDSAGAAPRHDNAFQAVLLDGQVAFALLDMRGVQRTTEAYNARVVGVRSISVTNVLAVETSERMVHRA